MRLTRIHLHSLDTLYGVPEKDSAREQEANSRRGETMDDAKAIVAISAGSLSPQAERLAAAVVADEITGEQAIAELLRQHP